MVNVIASFGIFCGPNHINHFMCELRFLIALACDDIKLTKVILNSLSAFMILIPLSVILCSYSCILYVGFQMQSIMGCYKVLSTCGSHLVLVTLFYGTIISIYITPHSSSSPDKNKKIAILYLVVTPLFNPIIYTFWNKDVHRAVIKNTKMSTENFTSETGFILLGFTSQQNQCIVLFVVFLTMYLLTVLGNLLIIILVHIDAQLHTPMYFFLNHLASLDIVYVTCSLPQTLAHLLPGKGVVSSIGCVLQGGTALSLACTECLLLGVMAYDCSLAICNPLRYVSAMDRKHQHLLVISCWIRGCLLSTVTIVCIFRHSFCGLNLINHFFCELRFLLDLARDDIKRTKDILNGLSVFAVLVPFS
ncbi:hypothetical protein E2320_003396, partial [Naja naja]